MTQEPKAIEAYKLIDLIDLVAIAKNALMLLEDFQTDIHRTDPENSDIVELTEKLDDMMKDTFVERFITLDDDFDSDTVAIILDNSQKIKPKDQREEVLASCDGNGKGIIKVSGRLAEYIRQAETAEIKLDELQNALIDSDFVKENFWAYRSIDNDLDEARDRLTPLLANTMRVKS